MRSERSVCIGVVGCLSGHLRWPWEERRVLAPARTAAGSGGEPHEWPPARLGLLGWGQPDGGVVLGTLLPHAVLGTASGTQRVLCCARWEAVKGWSRMSCARRGTCLPSRAKGRSAAGAFRRLGFFLLLRFAPRAGKTSFVGKAAR